MILVVVAFAACSKDDNPTNNGGNNTDTTKVVSKFDFTGIKTLEFVEYSIDTNKVEIADTRYEGKLTQNNTEIITFLNLPGLNLNKVYTSEKKHTDAKYVYANDSARFFVNEEVINSMVKAMAPAGFNLPFILPSSYYKIADTKLDKWEVFNQKLDNFIITKLGPNDITANGTLNLNFTRNSNAIDYTYKNAKIKVNECKGELKFSGVVPYLGNQTIELSVNINFYVNYNLGIVKQWIPSTSFKIAGSDYIINGQVFELK